jgi:hypothetical protein
MDSLLRGDESRHESGQGVLMTARRTRKRVRGTKPRSHLTIPFRRIVGALPRMTQERRRIRPARG